MELDTLLMEELKPVIDTQLDTGDPPETRETFDRLKNAGYSEDQVKNMIARVLVVEMHTVVSEGQPFNRKRFARMLSDLPSLPEEHWD